MAIIQKESISKQDRAATVTYPPRAFTIPFTDYLPMLFSAISLLLFSTLSCIFYLGLSNLAEHTICHGMLCLYIHTPSQLSMLYLREMTHREKNGIGFVVLNGACLWDTRSISECTGVSIHCEYTEVRFTVSSRRSCTSKHVLSGKDVILRPGTGNPTITTVTHCFLLLQFPTRTSPKVSRKEHLS